MVKALHTNKAPQAIGPYSQAIDIGDLVFVSGQIPLDPETMEVVEGDIAAQTEQVMKNLQEILSEAGLTFANVQSLLFILQIWITLRQLMKLIQCFYKSHTLLVRR